MEHYEIFCDIGYYDLWCVRPLGERRFGHGFHFVQKEVALRAKEELEGKWGTDQAGILTGVKADY